MGTLIDTSVIIRAEREGVGVLDPIGDRSDSAFLSVISVSELLHGVWRAKDEGTRTRRNAFVEAVLREFTIIDIDSAVARIHAQIWAEQKASGLMIGAHDLWLAATCIAHGFSIATANVREFSRIRGLQVEVW
ncbi:MAG TPA: type II toxin-antitoxin system VapC family toxin [Longimicrobiaceae bacterium]